MTGLDIGEIMEISNVCEFIQEINKCLSEQQDNIIININEKIEKFSNDIYKNYLKGLIDNEGQDLSKEIDLLKNTRDEIDGKIREIISKNNNEFYNELLVKELNLEQQKVKAKISDACTKYNKLVYYLRKRNIMKHKINSKLKFYYRGQYGAKYLLMPRILRNNELKNEDKYYHEIMVRCAKEFLGLSHLDKLVLMQHYECPTRLLDITANPLIALYFACKNFKCDICNKEKDGKVYIFAIEEEDILYNDSDKILMLACLPKFNKSEKNK
ncbi:FRG domain-containing protein, partial [bacterium]|nr:FRG domain-containing protein [bacterium]